MIFVLISDTTNVSLKLRSTSEVSVTSACHLTFDEIEGGVVLTNIVGHIPISIYSEEVGTA